MEIDTASIHACHVIRNGQAWSEFWWAVIKSSICWVVFLIMGMGLAKATALAFLCLFIPTVLIFVMASFIVLFA